MKSSADFRFWERYCTRRERARLIIFHVFPVSFVFVIIVCCLSLLSRVQHASVWFGAISGKRPNNICLACAQAYAAIRINDVVWCVKGNDNIDRNGRKMKEWNAHYTFQAKWTKIIINKFENVANWNFECLLHTRWNGAGSTSCMCGIVFKSSHSKFHKYENKYDFMQNC